MKTSLFVIASLSVLIAPAVAGNSKKKTREPIKPVTLVAAAKLDAAKLDAAKLDAAKPDAAKPDVAASADSLEPLASSELLDIPMLPPDPSSALQPYAELERRPLVTAKPMKASKDKTPQMNMGKDFVLGRRQSAKLEQREVEQIIPRSLSQAQVATVVQSHMSDIQNCWDLVPKAHRADACTAELKLSISDAGVVTDIELGGNVPAGAHRCITSAVAKWAFPATETKSEIEYGISLRSL